MGSDHQHRLLAELPPHQQALLVASAEAFHGGSEPRGHHVEVADDGLGEFEDAVPVQAPQRLKELGFPLAAQDAVLGQVETHSQPEFGFVFGDVGQAQAVELDGVEARHVLAPQPDLPLEGPPQAGYGLHQLALAVALDPGDAEDFPGPDLEGYPLDGDGVEVAHHVQILDPEHRFAGLTLFAGHARDNLSAHHHHGQLFRSGFRGGDPAGNPTAS